MADSTTRRGFPIDLPGEEAGPLRKILVRLAIALALVAVAAGVGDAGRDGYIDPEGGGMSVLDAFYYSTVSITTTGYGDIIPASDEARLITTVVVTPARVLFLILLVGTTLEILAERSREAYRLRRWRKRLKDHTIVCGYGVKGRAAMRTLLGKGIGPEQIVAIEQGAAGRARPARSRRSAPGRSLCRAGCASRRGPLPHIRRRSCGLSSASSSVSVGRPRGCARQVSPTSCRQAVSGLSLIHI